MSERRRTTQLAGRNPSIRLSPLPAGNGNTLQPFPQIRGGHRINVDADVLGEETRQGLQTSTFKIAVRVFRRSDHQRKTNDETYGRLKRSEEHTSELQSRLHLVCRLLLEKKKK